MKIYSQFEMKNTKLLYVEKDGVLGVVFTPEDKEICLDKICPIEPLVQLHLLGDDCGGPFANGLTMRGSGSVKNLRFVSQERRGNEIVTCFKNPYGHVIKHCLTMLNDVVEMYAVFENLSERIATLEMISSFSLGGLTPFEAEEESGDLVMHRLQSFWYTEGRLLSQRVEELQLEPCYTLRCERFGSIGSQPIRKYFPFIAVEDTKNNVTWAAQLYLASSWQIEVSRLQEGLSVSGGIADWEFGHWKKEVLPGEAFATPKAVIAVASGGVNEAAQLLVRAQRVDAPQIEEDMPIVFNEYCTTWGNPTFEGIKKMADKLKNRGVRYFVIDAGWYRHPQHGWDTTMGDWDCNREWFPNGLKESADYIRKCGMIPGLWFEPEVVGRDSEAFGMEEHMLKRDGEVITAVNRRFWDMADPWVTDYLAEKLIKTLKDNGFGYLKIDYNENIGIGADGCESHGEGLRQRILASQEFFKKIRREMPDLVMENCASGGHRLEPSMMELFSQASFSDAHTSQDIPVIAANLHRAIKPEQSQIWAVLWANGDSDTLYYSMINTFLGRMCLSGEIYDLSDWQWRIVEEGMEFYKAASSIIKYGTTKWLSGDIKSCYKAKGRHQILPKGHQVILREYGDRALLVVHSFKNTEKALVEIPCRYQVEKEYGNAEITLEGGVLNIPGNDYKAKAYLLKSLFEF